MGGDHKCPVCQATFTRPQHVARHMRSHTGDRPYKCQYCGDQFARSDLLSRHVNKCHASEKPLQNAGSARRKGTVSATRATTSKQSCDQCVSATLPCDGSNPCLKCISRKHQCTYVKFHRQTAPIGPGHNTRPTAPADAPSGGSLPTSSFTNGAPSSRLPLYQHSDDEFVLGPAPGSVPTMAESLYGSNSYAFPPLYPPTADLNAIPDNLDYGGKYRPQQAEFYGPGRPGMGTGLTPLYDPRHGTSTSNPSWLSGWEGQGAHDVFHHSQGPRQAELMPNHGPSSAMHDKPELAHHPAAPNFGNQSDNQPIPMAMPYPTAFALPRLHTSSPHQHGQGRNSSSSYDSSNPNSRRGSVDFSGSDSTSVSGHASGSVPCSANCSNVHLPLGNSGVNPLAYDDTGYNLASNVPHRTPSASSSSSQHDGYDPHDRQEFSSAFGLMSLDDPAVIAGLAVDGQPFFDDPSHAHNHQESTDPEHNHDGLLTTDVGPDIDTPMPLKRDATHPSISQRPATSSGAPLTNSGGVSGNGYGSSFGIGNLLTPSKDPDTRELRDFWKQYMRTPLSGPQDAIGNIAGPTISSKNPSPTAHRRQRVASLPSAKTPMVERDDMFVHHPSGLEYPAHQPDQRGRENAPAFGPTSSLRTTLHVKEDLSSYEAAVMARKAPTLNLQLKRPVKGKSLCTANQQPQGRGEARNTKLSQHSNANPPMGYGSRPPSSSAIPRSSSTLANAFGGHSNSTVSLASTRSLSGKEESVSPSLSSSRDTSDAYSTSTSSDVELRPSFKRLASQTLGPDNSKRTFFGYDVDEVSERDKTGGWSTTVPELPLSEFGGTTNTGTPHPVGSIAERRRRRMSAPSSTIDAAKVSQGGQHSQPTDDTGLRPLGYAPATQGGVPG